MSESETHRNLIELVAGALAERYPRVKMICDIQQNPGDEVPPKIGSFRPDVYGTDNYRQTIIIAEAKTDKDIDNRHTEQQVKAFIKYLEQFGGTGVKCLFALSATYSGADLARTILRINFATSTIRNLDIAVFDGLDFWLMKTENRRISWHLN